MDKILNKVANVGQFGVGKTSLKRRFVQSIFNEDHISTIGVNIDEKTIELDNVLLKNIISDIDGESSITVVNSSYLKGSQDLFLVSDLTRRETFLSFKQNVSDHRRAAGDKVPIKLLCKKTDMLDPDALDSQETNIPIDNYILTSAKTRENVEEAFLELAKDML
ncbi:MAG: GTP-binding protein [Flavobacteriales bacterium]|nr:GTP-binding protein [Flavobacteriales bacterium]